MSFLIFGSFLDKENRLSLINITDARKDVVKTSGDTIKTNKLKKYLNRSTYDTSNCVLLTEQTL